MRIIVDATAVMYRSYFALKAMMEKSTDLELENNSIVIFGFLNQIKSLLSRTENLVFCWDSPNNLRKDVYPKYKSTRRKKREQQTQAEKDRMKSVYAQAEVLKAETLSELGFVNNFEVDGLEADDLIAILVNSYKNQNTLVFANDNDLFQLLQEGVRFLFPTNYLIFGIDEFKAKFKVEPSQWATAKAIGGCRDDDVDGIVGAADPKSETSKALSYIRGELTKGVIYNRIRSKEGREIIKRNLPLVRLPYKQVDLEMKAQPKLELSDFEAVFRKYNFKSHLKDLHIWRGLI